jgi:hypothetical protein
LPVEEHGPKGTDKAGFTVEWSDTNRKICQAFYAAIRGSDDQQKTSSRKALYEMLEQVLLDISRSEQRYGVIRKR